jgi:adenylosuccinate lyase
VCKKMERYDLISPLDYRYVTGELYAKLRPYLSETAAIKYQGQVEAALARALAEEKICSRRIADEIEKAASQVTAEEVYKEEERIKHNIRALVNCIRKRVSDEAKPFVHLTATSNDIVSTAEAARLRDSIVKMLIPELLSLEKTLIGLAEREKNTLQIGRTHGQHAEPITFGFTVASYVARLGGRIEALSSAAGQLRGKMAGAVGNYNASSLLVKDAEAFERRVLKKMNLLPGSISTQIVEAEYAVDVMHAVVSCFGVLANIADDMRHLQRSEIGEVAEAFGGAQVGSSTMPHKRNPITFEKVKSLWKAFMPRMDAAYMDQISEHQRDLTNSASSRFSLEIVAGCVVAANTLNGAMRKLVVDRTQLRKNFSLTSGKIAAEPAYIILAALGHPDAHEAVRKLTLQEGKNFSDLLLSDVLLAPYVKRMSKAQVGIIRQPENYIGIASRKVDSVCKEWRKTLNLR